MLSQKISISIFSIIVLLAVLSFLFPPTTLNGVDQPQIKSIAVFERVNDQQWVITVTLDRFINGSLILFSTEHPYPENVLGQFLRVPDSVESVRFNESEPQPSPVPTFLIIIENVSAGTQFDSATVLTATRQQISLDTEYSTTGELWCNSSTTDVLQHTIRYELVD